MELLAHLSGLVDFLYDGLLHTRRIAVLRVAAHRLPARHHFAGGRFRIVGTGDRGHHEPAGRLRTGQHLHIVGMYAAADHYRELARRANRVDLFLVKRVPGTVVAAHGSLRLGGGHM